MKQFKELFGRLKEYRIAPPPGVRGDLFGLLRKEEPPSLHFLQEAATVPPAHLLNGILEKIGANPGRKSVVSRTWWTAAAACILLALAGWWFYRAGHPLSGSLRVAARTKPLSGQSSPLSNEASSPPTATGTGDTLAAKDRIGEDSASSGMTASHGAERTRGGEDYFKTTRIEAEGRAIPLSGDDLLVTLTAFREDQLPFFLDRDDRPLMIRADAFTSITLSEAMRKMMKRMYSTRSNGRPTRKARKERERLEEWKKDDESRFDGAFKNPLDPVDLAEFIFK